MAAQPTVVQAITVETNPQPGGKAGQPVQATVVGTAPVQAAVVGQPVAVPGQPVAVAGFPGAVAMGAGMVAQGGIPAEDPTILAVIACFCCCWCIGIVAIMKAQTVNQYNMTGNYAQAHAARKEALQWIYGTVGVGTVLYIINIVLRLVMASQTEDEVSSSSRYNY
mmetsp:Transcript_77334/g.137004  ORF Transcript_77334/g.137004 Transcript_77334/m.137004 type:complete len:166 (+) Transcript_77334:108-605(+)